MAQRHEIEAWVNPPAWDDPADAERVIDEIEASGSDSEADWTRIAFGGDSDAAGPLLDAASRDYDRAGEAFEAARDALREAVLSALSAGMSEVEAAQRAGVTRMTVRKWAGK